MSTHKEIIQQYLDGVHRGDHELVLSLVTDDVLLERKGQPGFRGKDVLRNIIDNKDGIVHQGVEEQARPVHKIDRMIEEGDTVVVSGTVITPVPGGGQVELLMSDYFTFTGDKISSLESYLIGPVGQG
jgi:ketosteroid isomerase-like protein